MTYLQEHWEGVSLPGDYTLEQWFAGDDNAAFFQSSLSADGRRAVVKLIPETAPDAAARLDLWQRTRHLRHPNLVEFIDCGRAEHDGQNVVYAVFEAPDDTLSTGLSRSPLDRDESRQVLDSVLGALRYLHAQGLVHGAVDADRIVAVGDQVKLTTDALHEAGASSAYREDVRLFGELWREALMPASPKSVELAAYAADPNPESRWTLAEIASALQRATFPPPLPVAPPPAPPSLPPPPGPAFKPVEPPAAVRKDPPSLPPLPRPAREEAAPRSVPKWIPVGAAAVLLLILGIHWWGSAGPASPSKVASASRSADAPASAPAPVPNTAAPKAPAPATSEPVSTSGKEMWRVIAFTYRTHDAAAKKTQQLNDLHPGIHAEVFSPKGKRGYYLVALGGRMTREDAVRLQHTARGKGLPRDLYVQNYTQ